ncbi:MAG: DUF5723 family protein [Marinilabiliales bacterium]|nr:DUF5723 family protein [Marinilabiliales bacterium]
MKRHHFQILLLLILLAPFGRLEAQPDIFYFLKGVPQTKDLNPARPGLEKGFYLGLPLFSKLDLSVNTNHWSYSDLIHRGSGIQADSMVWDFPRFLSVIGRKNFLMESAALTLLEFGWKNEDDFYGFSWSEKEYAEAFFTKDLANLIYYGNNPLLGSNFHSGYFGVSGQHYRELAFNFSRKLDKKYSFGFTAKLLFGMSSIRSSGINAVAGLPASGDYIDLNASGSLMISAPVDVQVHTVRGYRFGAVSRFDANSYFTNFGNPGFAADLGMTDRINKKLELSASLIDLGIITYSNDVSAFVENGHYHYTGIPLIDPTGAAPTATNIRPLVTSLRDSLAAAFAPDSTKKSFSALLPAKIYLAADYKWTDKVNLGALARVRIYNNQIHTSYTASLNAALSKKFSLSAGYSWIESSYDNLGLAAAWRWGLFQFYAASDNLLSFYHPSAASNMNLRFGINLIFNEVARPRKGVFNRNAVQYTPGCPFLKD